MTKWHYHANHVDAPARSSKAAAMKDASRKYHVHLLAGDHRVEPIVNSETRRAHGLEFPMIVRCTEACVIERVAAMREP